MAVDLSVVVVSYNTAGLLERCLRSIRAHAPAGAEVFVVDNASHDGSADAVAAEFPDVVLIRNERNLGYAGGMNAGMRRAAALGAEYVLLLNNDVEVDRSFVSTLVDEALRRPDAAALCSKVLYADPPDVIWFAGARFDPRSGYNGRLVGHGERDSERFASVAETDRVAGTAVLVPHRALDDVGLFDSALFAYVEDTDWSLRARAAGYRLLVVPGSRVWHRVSAASGGENAPATLYYNVRNLLVVCERHAPLGPAQTWRRRLVVVAVHLLQAVRSRDRRAAVEAVLEGWRDFRRGRLGPREAR